MFPRPQTSIHPLTLSLRTLLHFKSMTYCTSSVPRNHKSLSIRRHGKLSVHPDSITTDGILSGRAERYKSGSFDEDA